MRISFGWVVVVAIAVSSSHAQPPASGPVRPTPTASPEIGGKSLDQWIKDIEDKDPSVREHAIKMVAMLGPQARKAVPALIRQMRTPNDLSPMTNAAIAIGLILPDDPKHQKEAVAGLMQLLGSSQGIIRLQAATALGNIGPPARNAVPLLVGMTRDQFSWEIRKAAAYALGRCGVDEKNLPDIKALTALADAVDDLSKEVRVESLQGLINLGSPVTPADQQALKVVLEKRVRSDRDKYVGIWVRVALMRLDPNLINDQNLTYIAKHLKQSDPPGINADSARALGAMGSTARSKVPDLIDALKSSDTSLVSWAAWALGQMGGEAKSAVPALTSLLESADTAVKTSASEAIKNINNPKKP
ncbi:MAG: HEAT repeat domain-containing protein [Gemmataceae bacterium]|nr:HEAT repeat domain-containing protein [Gemmataceae bacterium]